MFRIDEIQFDTREEAEEWAHGNVGGVYSIIPLAFCHTCGDWSDDDEKRCSVCGAIKACDGEFYNGNKVLAKAGFRYWRMPSSHPLWKLRCWVFGFPIHG